MATETTSSRRGRLGDRWPWILGLGAALFGLVTGWRFVTHPSPRLDASWQMGLHQAIQDGLRFGTDIVFTYGPLGFLSSPTPYLGLTSTLAFLATAGITFVLLLLVFVAARRVLPLWAALIACLLAGALASVVPPFETGQLVLFAAGVELLRRERVARPMLIAVLAAVLAAIGMLGKVNVGVFLGAGGALVVLAVSPSWWRGLLAYLGSLVVATLALWLVTGQQLPDLAPYAKGSLELISGYSDAMGVTHGGRWFVTVAFAVLTAVMLACAWLGSRGWPLLRRLALLGIVALLAFGEWKHGFVRDYQRQSFYTLLVGLLFLVPPMARRRTAGVWLVAGLVLFLIGTRAWPSLYLPSPAAASAFAHQAADALLPFRWNGAEARTTARLQLKLAIPPDVLDAIKGQTVHIDPYAASVASAYPSFTWRPVPVFQSYSAYTPYLDNLNADALRSDQRPSRILRWFQLRNRPGQPTTIFTIDGRNYWFESPAATLERMCRYREQVADGDWQVLAASGTSCGAEVPLGSVSAAPGEPVPVPAAPSPDDIVLVKIHGVEGTGLLDRLRTSAWKSPIWFVTLDGRSFRFVPGTADQGLLLAVPTAIQGSPPFAFGDPTKTISVRSDRSTGSAALTYEFVAVPTAP